MHPYTTALMSAVPVPDTRRRHERERIRLQGDVPEPDRPAAGLPLPHPLLEGAGHLPTQEPPLLQVQGVGGDHQVACHFPENAPDTHAR